MSCFICLEPCHDMTRCCRQLMHPMCGEEWAKRSGRTEKCAHCRQSQIVATPEQQAVVDEVFSDGRPNVLLLGPGGVGKSEVIKMIMRRADEASMLVCLTAMTGVAAYNVGGQTLHRALGLGLARGEPRQIVKGIQKRPAKMAVIRALELLIIDEVSMLGLELFNKVDEVLRIVRRNRTRPFGGVQVLMSGDFLQLPPVRGEWVFQSDGWHMFDFRVHCLEMPMRYADRDWFELLMRVRDGFVSQEDDTVLRERLEAYHEYCKAEHADTDIRPTVFYSTNRDVDALNHAELRALPGDLVEFAASDTYYNSYDEVVKASPAYQKVCNERIPDMVRFKVNAQVMLKANLDPAEGYCNGSRGIVTRIDRLARIVYVRFMNDETVPICDYVFEYRDSEGGVVRRQIPLVLAWSMTIHKCVPVDTRVFTTAGIRPIGSFSDQPEWSEPREAVTVCTPKGVQPLRKVYRGTEDTVYEFVTNMGYRVCGTTHHAFAVGNVGWISSSYTYVKCPDISVNDFLCVVPRFDTDNDVPCLEEDGVLVNEMFATMIGCFWGDLRPRTQGRVVWYDYDLLEPAERVAEEISRVFTGADVAITPESVVVTSELFAAFVRSYDIDGVPDVIMRSPQRVQLAFLDGVRQNRDSRTNIHSYSLNRIRDLQLLYLNCGYTSDIVHQTHVYTLYRCMRDSRKPIVYDRIVSKRVLDEPVQTYDIEVAEEHCFVANGLLSHNSQSCSLDYAIGDLGPSVFAPGQAYVYLSRVRTRQGCLLSDYRRSSIKADQAALEFTDRYRDDPYDF